MKKLNYLVVIVAIHLLVACAESAQDAKAANDKPLDLSLPDTLDTQAVESMNFEKENQLPDLFKEKTRERNVSVGGKVLNDKSNPDYIDSIEGAELSIKVKTN